MKSDAILSVREFIDKAQGGTFVIPPYQRGYKWGVPDSNGQEAVGVLVANLLEAYREGKPKYFIQGVTVFEKEKDVYLIDGQQRTTTLYLLLSYLSGQPPFKLHYTIREESDKFLNEEENASIFQVIQACRSPEAEEESRPEQQKDYQDIHYFKQAIHTIHGLLMGEERGKVDPEAFEEYVRTKAKLFYVVIQESQAPKTFRLLNGSKAIMLPQELIKAGFLSKASRVLGPVHNGTEREQLSQEWEINALRSRYARQWDRWVYWWRRPEVQALYRNDDAPLGLLLPMYYHQHYPRTQESSMPPFTYQAFADAFMRDAQQAKEHFGKLRKLQKRFEDWFHDIHTYNYLGLIVQAKGGGKDGQDAIGYLMGNAERESMEDFKKAIKEYAKWALVEATHRQITAADALEELEETVLGKAEKAFSLLSSDRVFLDEKEAKPLANLQLLRLNVERDQAVGRRFDFSLYGEKSLEHIWPKSKAAELGQEYIEGEGHLVHTIGNLVLLKKNENSAFGDKSFPEKKRMYFEPESDRILWSLKLLHSVSIFSSAEWNEQSIRDNQQAFLAEFRSYYGLPDPPKNEEGTQPTPA